MMMMRTSSSRGPAAPVRAEHVVVLAVVVDGPSAAAPGEKKMAGRFLVESLDEGERGGRRARRVEPGLMLVLLLVQGSGRGGSADDESGLATSCQARKRRADGRHHDRAAERTTDYSLVTRGDTSHNILDMTSVICCTWPAYC